MASTYILYSKFINHYYVGSCRNIDLRIDEHNQQIYKNSFTIRAKDWTLFLEIGALDYEQSRKIEMHIKSMKSRIYIENLKRYPEMIAKLRVKYK